MLKLEHAGYFYPHLGTTYPPDVLTNSFFYVASSGPLWPTFNHLKLEKPFWLLDMIANRQKMDLCTNAMRLSCKIPKS